MQWKQREKKKQQASKLEPKKIEQAPKKAPNGVITEEAVQNAEEPKEGPKENPDIFIAKPASVEAPKGQVPVADLEAQKDNPPEKAPGINYFIDPDQAKDEASSFPAKINSLTQSDLAIAVKTGLSTGPDRLPIQLQTFLSSVDNLIILSDFGGWIGNTEMYNVFENKRLHKRQQKNGTGVAMVECGGQLVYLDSDVNNCGNCGVVCPSSNMGLAGK